jgi:hypothetical protein
MSPEMPCIAPDIRVEIGHARSRVGSIEAHEDERCKSLAGRALRPAAETKQRIGEFSGTKFLFLWDLCSGQLPLRWFAFACAGDDVDGVAR